MCGARVRHAILPLAQLCLLSSAWAQLGVNPSDFDAVLPYNSVVLQGDHFPITLGTQTYRRVQLR